MDRQELVAMSDKANGPGPLPSDDGAKGLTVAVLMGGTSAERDISLETGKAVMKGLTDAGVKAIDVVLESNDIAPLLCLTFDVVFVALHGTFGEDGRVQQLLEDEDLAYTGSDPAASRLAMDKSASKRLFREAGLLTPPGVEFCASASPAKIAAAADIFGYPVIIKPVCQGSSFGATIVDCAERLAPAFVEAARFDERVLVEQVVGEREFTVGILDDRPLPVIELITSETHFNYKAKYCQGYTEYVFDFKLPAAETKRIQESALAAHLALGCRDFSRVDFRYGRLEGPYVLELNTIPGLTSHSLVPKAAARAGMDFSDLVVRMVLMAARRRTGKQH